MEHVLREMIAKIAETDAGFSPKANLRDELKVDSVRVFELVFEIERAFNVKFPEERYAEARTFDDLLNLVKSLKMS